MDYLFGQLNKIEELLRNKFILLLLDYDGTLVPIAETPRKAVIRKETKELLQKLSKGSYCKIAIISGRSLVDIKNAVGVRDIIYAGNHGLEIEGPKIKFESLLSPRLKSVVRNIAQDFPKKLSGIKGVLFEDKGLTLSIHYRLAEEKDLPVLKGIISEVTYPYTVRNKIRINSGKKVYEIRPPVNWDKGKVVLWLLGRVKFSAPERQIVPVYIGDDLTDEDAFRALKRKGITIFVGKPGHSVADYYLKDAREVTKFLNLILKQKGK